MRTLVIGDVHGCLDELRDLLLLVSFVRGTDRLVFVGDLMDRGPAPVDCIRFARELGAEAVESNHDEKFVRFAKHEAVRLATGKKNPMKLSQIPEEREQREAQGRLLNEDDLAWIKSLPEVLHIAPNMVVVHAGLEPAFSVADQSDAVVRVRYVDNGARDKRGVMVGATEDKPFEKPENTDDWSEQWKGPESVIYGHAIHSMVTPRVDRFEGGACYGIDTGCVYGGRLTAAVVVPGHEVEFAQVQARQVYYEKHHA